MQEETVNSTPRFVEQEIPVEPEKDHPAGRVLVRRVLSRSGAEYFIAKDGSIHRSNLKRGEMKELKRLKEVVPEFLNQFSDDPIGLVRMVKKTRAHGVKT